MSSVDVHERDTGGTGELGDIAGVDPLPRLLGAVFGAHENNGDVEASIIAQPHDSCRHTLRNGDRQRENTVSGGLVEIGRVGALEWFPTGKSHHAVDRGEELGVDLTVGGRKTADRHNAPDRARSLVGDHPGECACRRMPDDHGTVGSVDGFQGGGDLVGQGGSARRIVDTGQGNRYGPMAQVFELGNDIGPDRPRQPQTAMRMMSIPELYSRGVTLSQ